jgi:hypothetical protein
VVIMNSRELMDIRSLHKVSLAFLISATLSFTLEGQQKEVHVVKPYSPTLSGANKIQLLPSLDEEIEYETPEFTYQLFPKLYDTEYRVEPIRAARMVKMPLKKLYKSQLTLGMGNYLTPLAEIDIDQLRSRNGTFGLSVKHHSMNGKVKLDNEEKVPAGFSESSLDVRGSRFLRKSVFDYYAGTGYRSYIHYGIDTDTAEVSVIPEKDSLRHPYFLAEGGINLHSAGTDSSQFNYDVSVGYHYFTHRFDQAEHAVSASMEFHKKLRTIDLAGETGGAFFGHPDWDQYVGNHTMIWLRPLLAKSSSEWRFTAGINIYLSVMSVDTGNQPVHFYPRGSFEFDVVKKIIVPYFGVDGYLESNHYRKSVEENPYIVPVLSIKPASHNLIAYAGLKGRITDAVGYNIKGSYSIIDDQYFFVNDTSLVNANGDRLKNQFTVEYNDITLLNLHGEIAVRPRTNWKIFLKGNYYNYTLTEWTMANGEQRDYDEEDDHPWNKPAFDLTLEARYNMADKILVNFGIYTVGRRYYEDFDPSVREYLPLVVDANLGIEYRYTKLLSFWARCNNLAAQVYYLYPQYPSFRFRAMLGFTYVL